VTSAPGVDPRRLPGVADEDGDPRRWLILGVLCLVLAVVAIDNTIVNVAVPSLQLSLDASEQDLQWITTSYGLVLAGLLLPLATIGDRRGRKGLLLSGLVILGVACGVASLVDSPGMLIAARGLMGVGGACALPGTLSIIGNVFPESERGRAIAIWSGSAGLATTLGPVLGGLLLEHYWWGSVFLVNLPIVAVGIVGVAMFVPTSRDPAAPPIDVRGSLCWTVALVGLLFGTIEGPERGWTSPLVLGAYALTAVVLLAFRWVEQRAVAPIVDLAALRTRRLQAGIAIVASAFFVLFGVQFVTTQELQLAQGLGPLATGLCFAPFALAAVGASLENPRLVKRYGHRVAGLSFALVALGLLVTAPGAAADSVAAIVVGLFVVGVGINLALPSGIELIMESAPPERAGAAAGINETLVEASGAIGVAVMGSVIAAGATGSELFSADAVPWALVTGVVVAVAGGLLAWGLLTDRRTHASGD
jgi:MFS family permease